ncbi:hypothetical protein HDE_01644 [Halotydeus destructor]|nr:hypothetical protein HDE_01644 [Halotydeus destructor]
MPFNAIIEGVGYTDVINERGAAMFQNYNVTFGEEMDISGQFIGVYSTSANMLILFTVITLAVSLNTVVAFLSPVMPRVRPIGTKKPERFSLWNLMTSLLLQSDYDPVHQTRRIFFATFLSLVFILFSVAWNCVGTALVVTQTDLCKSLQDVYEINSEEFFLDNQDWPAAKFKDPRKKLANKIYVKHCKPREADCMMRTGGTNKITSMLYVKFKIVSEQEAVEYASRHFCAVSMCMGDQEYKRYSTLVLNELTEPFSLAFNSRLSDVYSSIVHSAARQICETGLTSEKLLRSSTDFDTDQTYSDRTCTMKDTLEEIAGNFRAMGFKDFRLVFQFITVSLVMALVVHLKHVLRQFWVASRERQAQAYPRYQHTIRRFKIGDQIPTMFSETIR